MANLYVSDETKKKVDLLADTENRTLDRQVNFMCDQRLEQLGLKAPETEESNG